MLPKEPEFISLPKIKWNHEHRFWEEPVIMRVRISEIANYGPWRFTNQDQRDKTKFAISKVMLRRLRNEEDQTRSEVAMMVVAMDLQELDSLLQPLTGLVTYRPG